MTRDALHRMDVDTGWPYNRKVRKLQQLYPDRWPIYWSAYMALLGEVWQRGRDGRRLTVVDTWCPALRCDPHEAQDALVAAGVTDKDGRVPARSWKTWVEPVIALLEARRAGGAIGAAKRWGTASPTGTGSGSPNGRPNSPARPARQPARNGRAQTRKGPSVDSPPLDVGSIMRQAGAGWLVDKEDGSDGIH